MKEARAPVITAYNIEFDVAMNAEVGCFEGLMRKIKSFFWAIFNILRANGVFGSFHRDDENKNSADGIWCFFYIWMDYMFFVCSYMDRKSTKKNASLEKVCFDTFEYFFE